MRLIELYIENFGKLTGYKYTFSSGLNVINEENGYGKSTLAAFIKSMLFGLEDTRKTKLDENDRKRYLPWQGGAFGGTLTFAVGEKKYRIERSFAQKASDDTFALYDCASGKLSEDYSENIGEELFGINVDGFERTVFLSERRLSVKNDNKTISAKLSDLVGCDGDVGELDEAIEMLEDRRKYYYKRGGSGRISEIRTDIRALESRINDITRISDALPTKEASAKAIAKEIGEIELRITEIDSKKQSLSYERQYLAKKSAKEDAERRLGEVKRFFKGNIPTQTELRQAERNADSYRALKERLATERRTADKESELERDIEAAERCIASLSEKKTQKTTKKLYPALILLSVIFAALGGVFAATVNLIAGISFIGLGAVLLAFAVANASLYKKSTKDGGLEAEALALLEREGMGLLTGGEILPLLIGIKAKKEADLGIIRAQAKKVLEYEATLTALAEECGEFLSGFSISESDPYLQIRQHISDYEYLTQRVRELTAEVDGIVRECAIDVERLNKNGAITSENADFVRAELGERLRRLRGELTLLENDYRRDVEALSHLDELCERKAELDEKLAESEEKLLVVNYAKDHLTRAKDLLTAKYLGKTRTAFAEYMRTIGNEDAERFTMDTSFGITKNEGGTSKPTEAYSVGIQDFFSLAARLALVETLYDKELPFVILDDPFAHFDDKKCATALKVLKRISERNQIIYFTCSKSRAV